MRICGAHCPPVAEAQETALAAHLLNSQQCALCKRLPEGTWKIYYGQACFTTAECRRHSATGK